VAPLCADQVNVVLPAIDFATKPMGATSLRAA
jgi:hypothetical protein